MLKRPTRTMSWSELIRPHSIWRVVPKKKLKKTLLPRRVEKRISIGVAV